MDTPEESELDFSSEFFDPLKALEAGDITLPFSKVTPYNNISEYNSVVFKKVNRPKNNVSKAGDDLCNDSVVQNKNRQSDSQGRDYTDDVLKESSVCAGGKRKQFSCMTNKKSDINCDWRSDRKNERSSVDIDNTRMRKKERYSDCEQPTHKNSESEIEKQNNSHSVISPLKNRTIGNAEGEVPKRNSDLCGQKENYRSPVSNTKFNSPAGELRFHSEKPNRTSNRTKAKGKTVYNSGDSVHKMLFNENVNGGVSHPEVTDAGKRKRFPYPTSKDESGVPDSNSPVLVLQESSEGISENETERMRRNSSSSNSSGLSLTCDMNQLQLFEESNEVEINQRSGNITGTNKVNEKGERYDISNHETKDVASDPAKLQELAEQKSKLERHNKINWDRPMGKCPSSNDESSEYSHSSRTVEKNTPCHQERAVRSSCGDKSFLGTQDLVEQRGCSSRSSSGLSLMCDMNQLQPFEESNKTEINQRSGNITGTNKVNKKGESYGISNHEAKDVASRGKAKHSVSDSAKLRELAEQKSKQGRHKKINWDRPMGKCPSNNDESSEHGHCSGTVVKNTPRHQERGTHSSCGDESYLGTKDLVEQRGCPAGINVGKLEMESKHCCCSSTSKKLTSHNTGHTGKEKAESKSVCTEDHNSFRVSDSFRCHSKSSGNTCAHCNQVKSNRSHFNCDEVCHDHSKSNGNRGGNQTHHCQCCSTKEESYRRVPGGSNQCKSDDIGHDLHKCDRRHYEHNRYDHDRSSDDRRFRNHSDYDKYGRGYRRRLEYERSRPSYDRNRRGNFKYDENHSKFHGDRDPKRGEKREYKKFRKQREIEERVFSGRENCRSKCDRNEAKHRIRKTYETENVVRQENSGSNSVSISKNKLKKHERSDYEEGEIISSSESDEVIESTITKARTEDKNRQMKLKENFLKEGKRNQNIQEKSKESAHNRSVNDSRTFDLAGEVSSEVLCRFDEDRSPQKRVEETKKTHRDNHDHENREKDNVQSIQGNRHTCNASENYSEIENVSVITSSKHGSEKSPESLFHDKDFSGKPASQTTETAESCSTVMDSSKAYTMAADFGRRECRNRGKRYLQSTPNVLSDLSQMSRMENFQESGSSGNISGEEVDQNNCDSEFKEGEQDHSENKVEEADHCGNGNELKESDKDKYHNEFKDAGQGDCDQDDKELQEAGQGDSDQDDNEFKEAGQSDSDQDDYDSEFKEAGQSDSDQDDYDSEFKEADQSDSDQDENNNEFKEAGQSDSDQDDNNNEFKEAGQTDSDQDDNNNEFKEAGQTDSDQDDNDSEYKSSDQDDSEDDSENELKEMSSKDKNQEKNSNQKSELHIQYCASNSGVITEVEQPLEKKTEERDHEYFQVTGSDSQGHCFNSEEGGNGSAKERYVVRHADQEKEDPRSHCLNLKSGRTCEDYDIERQTEHAGVCDELLERSGAENYCVDKQNKNPEGKNISDAQHQGNEDTADLFGRRMSSSDTNSADELELTDLEGKCCVPNRNVRKRQESSDEEYNPETDESMESSDDSFSDSSSESLPYEDESTDDIELTQVENRDQQESFCDPHENVQNSQETSGSLEISSELEAVENDDGSFHSVNSDCNKTPSTGDLKDNSTLELIKNTEGCCENLNSEHKSQHDKNSTGNSEDTDIPQNYQMQTHQKDDQCEVFESVLNKELHCAGRPHCESKKLGTLGDQDAKLSDTGSMRNSDVAEYIHRDASKVLNNGGDEKSLSDLEPEKENNNKVICRTTRKPKKNSVNDCICKCHKHCGENKSNSTRAMIIRTFHDKSTQISLDTGENYDDAIDVNITHVKVILGGEYTSEDDKELFDSINTFLAKCEGNGGKSSTKDRKGHKRTRSKGPKDYLREHMLSKANKRTKRKQISSPRSGKANKRAKRSRSHEETIDIVERPRRKRRRVEYSEFFESE